MKRFLDYLSGLLSGALVTLVLMAVIVPTPFYWSKEMLPTPRSEQHADPSDRQDGRTMAGVSPVPSPRVAAPSEAPDGITPAPLTPSPKPTGTRPAATGEPRTSRLLRGTATWFATAGGAAAGPALRRALGPGWRGRTVVVCAGACLTVRLTDWCLCSSGNRVIDLPAWAFRQLAPLSRGVLRVEVKW